MSTERDETYTILVKDKALATVKADLIHAFLSVSFVYIYYVTFLWYQVFILNLTSLIHLQLPLPSHVPVS